MRTQDTMRTPSELSAAIRSARRTTAAHRPSDLLAIVVAGLLLPACKQETSAPTAPIAMQPPLADVVTVTQAPFTVRAPLEPYRINQPPNFMVHSRARTDIVIQRSVFVPGAGPWHTHPGPSFVLVTQGQIKLQKFTREGGCFETAVFGPGQAYFEVADEVHRAVVVSSEDAVLLVTRFNIPVGGAITIPVADPGC